jgi:hypothetical protein
MITNLGINETCSRKSSKEGVSLHQQVVAIPPFQAQLIVPRGDLPYPHPHFTQLISYWASRGGRGRPGAEEEGDGDLEQEEEGDGEREGEGDGEREHEQDGGSGSGRRWETGRDRWAPSNLG